MLPIIREHRLNHCHPSEHFNLWPNLWDNFFNDVNPAATLGNLDIYEDEKNLYVEAELPGFNRDQIDLTLEDDILTLNAERNLEKDDSQDNYFLKERRQGKWSRSVRLPVDVLEDNIAAVFNDGLLKITLEKQPQHKVHKIEVK